MKLLYVAGPYRDPRGTYFVEQNIRASEAVAVHLWKMGVAVICPHTNTRHMDGVTLDDVFLDGDLEILKRCDGLVLVPNWQASEGTKGEVKCAVEKGILVFRWPEETDLIRRWLSR